MRYALGDARVTTDGDAFWIAPTAVVIGKVRLERNASVWWGAVLRGDNELITRRRELQRPGRLRAAHRPRLSR